MPPRSCVLVLSFRSRARRRNLPWHPSRQLLGGAQALGDIQVTLLVCELVRGQAVVILGIRIGAVFQQQLHHGMIAVLGGCVQGSPALLLARIDGSAMFQKSARDGEISSGRGGV